MRSRTILLNVRAASVVRAFWLVIAWWTVGSVRLRFGVGVFGQRLTIVLELERTRGIRLSN